MTSERETVWMVNVYKGEGRLLVVPQLRHIGNFYIDSENVQVIEEREENKIIGQVIKETLDYIKNSPISTKTLEERKKYSVWKFYSKYKTQNSFWRNNNCAFIQFFSKSGMKVHSAEKVCAGGYGGSIKEICLPSDATMEEIGKAVIDVLDAAEEYYQDKATEYIYPTKVVELLDNSKLTIKHPKDRHFVDSDDCHTAEIYQCYSYLPSEGAEASAEFLVGIGAEINCDLSCDNVKASWEKYYGEAESFEMCEEDLGIFKYRAELKNKGIHKISYFLKMQEDLLLECSMNLYKPNKRKKLDEKLTEMFGKFVLSCRFR